MIREMQMLRPGELPLERVAGTAQQIGPFIGHDERQQDHTHQNRPDGRSAPLLQPQFGREYVRSARPEHGMHSSTCGRKPSATKGKIQRTRFAKELSELIKGKRAKLQAPSVRSNVVMCSAVVTYLRQLARPGAVGRLLMQLAGTCHAERCLELQNENSTLRRRVTILETALADYSHRFGPTASARVAFALKDG